jgi:hypothetical protein
MSMSKIALAIPLALGIACSHSGAQSRDHSTSNWTPSDGGGEAPAQAQASDTGGSHEELSVQPTAGSSGSMGSGSSDSSGSSGSMGSSSGSSDSGGQGSGGSSETMGSGNAQGSSDHAQQGATAGAEGMGDHAADQHVAGKIAKISKDEISIQPSGASLMILKLNEDTTVSIGGKDAKWTQLKKGQVVRASYENVGGDDIAVRIESAAAHHARRHRGSSGSSGGGSAPSGDPGAR